MTENLQTLGELELAVLKTVWQNDGCTVQRAAEILSQSRKCARTTILTVIQRLHAKDFLTRKKEDGVYRYYATEKPQKVLGGLIRQFVDKVLDGSPAALVSYWAQSGVSAHELAQMQQVLEQAKSEQGEQGEKP
ncbi:MAG: BlaI/MecI/CopY family transcriptional regulator [Phycisphaerae bacterium]|nr:BlaI/MecI/CopY family transcriptional regulator [Phycisphaerae bacterium]